MSGWVGLVGGGKQACTHICVKAVGFTHARALWVGCGGYFRSLLLLLLLLLSLLLLLCDLLVWCGVECVPDIYIFSFSAGVFFLTCA